MVRYHNSGTQKFDDTEHESINTEVLNNVVSVSPSMSASEINSAIQNKLPDSGGTVRFQSGTYDLSGVIDLPKSYLSFEAEGAVKLTIPDTLQDNVISNETNADNEYFALRGIEIEGNRTTDGSNEDPDNSQSGVRAQNTSIVVIGDAHIHDTVDSSLNVGSSADHLFISDSRFEFAGHPNHETTDAFVVCTGDTQITIVGCYHNNTTDNAHYINNCQSAYIAGNTIKDCFVNAFDDNMNNVSYVNNELIGSPNGSGFFRFATGGSQNITISGNHVHDIGTLPSGFQFVQSLDVSTPINNVEISSNMVQGAGEIQGGVDWSAPCETLKITDNVFVDVLSQGWKVTAGSNVKIRGNTNKYTSVTDGDASSQANILASDGDGFSISDETVIDKRSTPSSNAYRVNGFVSQSDVVVRDNHAEGTTEKYNVDTERVNLLKLNGLGYNDGDPNTTGQWNGNGEEGLRVWDYTNSTLYEYAGGGWV